jgi:rhomboid-like protein
LKQRLQELSPGKKAILGITSINALVFLLWQIPVPGVRNFMMRNFLHSAYSGRTYTLLTSAFSHSTLWHFLFNTMAMWGFGDATHHLLGREYFLAFTASSAVTSSLSMHLWHAITRNAVPGLGSSGFVFSYVALTAMCYPTSKMQLFFAIPVPLLEGLYGLCIFDIIGLTGLWGKLFNLSLGHSAHLGGVGVGVGLYWLLVNKRRVRSFFPPELGRLYDRYYQTVFAPPTRWR